MNYFYLKLSSIQNIFSKVDSGYNVNFQIENTNKLLDIVNIENNDVIIISLADRIYYGLNVIEKNESFLTIRKLFEIEKSIDYKSMQEEYIKEITKDEYDLICSQLFKDFSNIISAVNENKSNDELLKGTKSKSEIINLDNLKEDFASWFIKLNGIKHNYFTDAFGSSRDKLLEQLTKYENLYKEQFGTNVFDLEQEDSSSFLYNFERNIYLEEGAFFQFSLKTSTHMPRAILGKNNYIKFLNELLAQKEILQEPFKIEEFYKNAATAGLIFSSQLIQRFIASLFTKPFVICSGLSGSGKTKLAQAFVQWISESDKQYKIIPVGADWTNREPLLGYPNGLDPKSYVTPDSGALQLILEALKVENHRKPYFMILDEMNLSHVERYFADFLSIMESKEKLKLYSGEKRYSQYVKGNEFNVDYFIPYEIEWPSNLFIIGTVNIDETTYMFSPKVLDRANVIEFRITPKEMGKYFKDRKELNMKELFLEKDINKGGAGQSMSVDFFQLAYEKTITKIKELEGDDNVLNEFFNVLHILGSEFGYRSASEIEILITKLGIVGFVDEKGQPLTNDTKIDIAIMQKLLPKLHGSRNKLTKVLPILGGFCLTDNSKIKEDYLDKFLSNNLTEAELEADDNIKYKISFDKICRMYKNAVENGFTSYAEA